MDLNPEPTNDVIEPGLTEAVQTNDSVPQTTLIPPDLPRKRKRKPNKTKPLDLPADEAIAQYLSTPKSIREFKSVGSPGTELEFAL